MVRRINYPKDRKIRDPVERFWEKVKRGSGCWLWTGMTNEKGYGRFTVTRPRPIRVVLAHRHSWSLANGPVPEGMCVLHRCDNPPCVRPDHLFLGTRADNNVDMFEKGRGTNGSTTAVLRRLFPERWPRGKQMPNAKLTDADVSSIRSLYASGEYSFVKLASRFGVGRTTIENVVKRRKWKHVS